jgi:hypothetical protein
MRRKRTAGAAPCTDQKSELQDQQFEEHLRIAEHIVQAFREAGYSCELADEAYSLNGVDLHSCH